MSDRSWWLLIRAAGLVGWAALAWSMLLGGLLAARIVHRPESIRRAVGLHRHASALALGLVVVHIVALLADSFVDFRAIDVFVPLASSWRPGAVAWGIAAMYIAAVVEVSSLLYARLSRRTWRAVHRLSALCFGSASIHLLQAGTESSELVVRWIVMTVVMILGFLYLGRPLGLFKRERHRADPGPDVAVQADPAAEPWSDAGSTWAAPVGLEAVGPSMDMAVGASPTSVDVVTELPDHWIGQGNRSAW